MFAIDLSAADLAMLHAAHAVVMTTSDPVMPFDDWLRAQIRVRTIDSLRGLLREQIHRATDTLDDDGMAAVGREIEKRHKEKAKK